MDLVMDAARLAAGAVGMGLLVLGAYAALRPAAASRGYGIAFADNESTARGYAVAAGWRDVSVGVATLALWVIAPHQVLGALLLAWAIIPLGDVLVLRRHGVRRAWPYVPHVAGCVGVLVVGVVLCLG